MHDGRPSELKSLVMHTRTARVSYVLRSLAWPSHEEQWNRHPMSRGNKYQSVLRSLRRTHGGLGGAREQTELLPATEIGAGQLSEGFVLMGLDFEFERDRPREGIADRGAAFAYRPQPLDLLLRRPGRMESDGVGNPVVTWPRPVEAE